jgi:pentatricopeptide repeat protein
MKQRFGIEPDTIYHSCILDALARAGRMQEAKQYLNAMPNPNAVSFMALLSGARTWKNVELAEDMAQRSKTPSGTKIRVTNNQRVCPDCHSAQQATKYIALVTQREISLRDASRWHHFSHGKLQRLLVNPIRMQFPSGLINNTKTLADEQ